MSRAEIIKIGDHETTPDLLLEMVRANIPRMKNVVVSVIFESEDGEDEYQATYHTPCKSSDLAYHAVAINDYLTGLIRDD